MGDATGERSHLSRDRIADAALELIDADGLSGLSMRKLGSALGVEAMSIYHYIANKDDLLDAVLERLCQEITVDDPAEGRSWDAVVRAAVGSFHRVLEAHPNTVGLFVSRPVAVRSEGFATFFGGYRLLRLAGLDAAEAHGALHVAVAFVLGHAMAQAGAEVGGGSFDLVDDDQLEDRELAEFVATGRALMGDRLFEQGVDLLIAGLRAEYKLG